MPGKDTLFSALNSSPQILQARLDGRLSSLVAGHFTLGGWAMVLINDDAKGIDINRHRDHEPEVALFELINPAQARRLLELQAKQNYHVNFKALSAVGKPEGYRYPFGLKLLMR